MNFNEQYFNKRGKWFPIIKALFFSSLIKVGWRPKTLLDVGCARGELVKTAVSLGINSYGIDISRSAFLSLSPWIKDRLLQGDILDIPFSDASFSLVTSLAVLEHLPSEKSERAVRELLRVSRKTVLVQICVQDSPFENNQHYLLDPTHVNVQTSSWWKEKFKLWGIKYQELLPKMGVFVLEI